jgi:hypothetical protein
LKQQAIHPFLSKMRRNHTDYFQESVRKRKAKPPVLLGSFPELTFAIFAVIARALRKNASREGSEGGEGWFLVPTQVHRKLGLRL